jgi:hypothetical protein
MNLAMSVLTLKQNPKRDARHFATNALSNILDNRERTAEFSWG